MFIRATTIGTTKNGSHRITHRLVENSRHGQKVKQKTLPLATTSFDGPDNMTIHIRKTATPDEIQTKVYQDMGLSLPPRNVRKSVVWLGIDTVQGGIKPARHSEHDWGAQVPEVQLRSAPWFFTPLFLLAFDHFMLKMG